MKKYKERTYACMNSSTSYSLEIIYKHLIPRATTYVFYYDKNTEQSSRFFCIKYILVHNNW